MGFLVSLVPFSFNLVLLSAFVSALLVIISTYWSFASGMWKVYHLFDIIGFAKGICWYSQLFVPVLFIRLVSFFARDILDISEKHWREYR